MHTAQWRNAVHIALLFPCVATFRPSVPLHSPFPVRLRACGARPAVQGRAGGVSSFAMQQDLDRSSRVPRSSGMQSTSAAASFNLAKAIVGAGSFSLPYVCKNQGVLGGLITICSCAMLAWYTMQVQARCYPPVPRDYFPRPVYACACLHARFEWMSSLARSFSRSRSRLPSLPLHLSHPLTLSLPPTSLAPSLILSHSLEHHRKQKPSRGNHGEARPVVRRCG
jgi:hypothetical protein